jgi:hypothetical protein
MFVTVGKMFLPAHLRTILLVSALLPGPAIAATASASFGVGVEVLSTCTLADNLRSTPTGWQLQPEKMCLPNRTAMPAQLPVRVSQVQTADQSLVVLEF